MKKLYRKIAVLNIVVFAYSAVSLIISILTGSDTWLSIGYSVFCLVSFIGVIRSSVKQAEINLAILKKKAKDEEEATKTRIE